MHFLEVAGIRKTLSEGFELGDIGFTLSRFEKLAIAGETGSGKSTLLKIIAGLVQPAAGNVFFEDRRIEGPDEQLVPGHPAIGYLSQHYELRNNYRVEELLEYATKIPERDAHALFDVCRISHLVKRRTDQLSGGEKQRIALARLLVGSPQLLLLDEPFSNLDPIHKQVLKSVIHDIGEKLSITVLLTSHDPMDTLSWADKIIVLKDGHIVQQSAPDILYHRPADEYVAGLFGHYYLLTREEIDLFARWRPNFPTDKRLFIRPGDIVPAGGREGVPAIVRESIFWGNFYDTTIDILGHLYSIRTITDPLPPGTQIRVQLAGKPYWFL